MLQLIKCLFGSHGSSEVLQCKDGELTFCRNCMKVKKLSRQLCMRVAIDETALNMHGTVANRDLS